MNIAFFEIKEDEKAFFQSRLAGHTLFFFEGTIQEELTKEEPFDVISLFIYSQIEDHLLSLLPNLKYLQTRSSGYEHVKCRSLYSREIELSNVSGYAGPAVAEFAFSLLLNISRHTHTVLERSERGNGNYLDLKGFELQGKTVGILGLGTIGTQMARIASDVCNDITLARQENFLYTPHMAYYTREALQNILEISLKNMQQFLAGQTPQNSLELACKKEY